MSNSPCAACKCLRRKCTQECAFAPYFPPDQPQRFSNVHKVFGASNVAKLLNDLDPSQREDAVNSLAYEAEARLRDPVYGCVGLISILQHQLKQIQVDLYSAKKELSTYIGPSAMMPLYQPNYHQPNPAAAFGVLQYNMDPMAGPSHVPTMGVVIRDVQAQTPQAQAHAHAHSQAQAPGQPQHLQLHHNAQQFIDAQQQLAAMATREDMEMMRNWEQQQQLQLQPEPEPEPQLQAQQFFRFDSGVGGAYEATTMLASGSNSGIGVGFNQLAGPSGVGSPSLALGGPSIEQNAYHHQIQEDEPQEPLLLLQQPETTLQQQKQGHEDDLGVGQEIPLQFQVLPQLQPSTSHRQLQFQLLHHRQLQHNQQQRPGSEQGISTVDPSC